MQENQENQQPARRLGTARECAKDLIRFYVLDGWTLAQLASSHVSTDGKEYAAQVGEYGGTTEDYKGNRHTLKRSQLAVTRVGAAPCWVVFEMPDLMAEIRDEAMGYQQQSLMEIFAQEEPAPKKSKKRGPVIYRSYMGGYCKQCGEGLGHIETEGGRDREFCDNNGKCRVAYHRARKREQQRAATLQRHGELREYWQLHSIRGEVLLRLQEILLQHGKEAARAATDAVLVALVAAEQAGSQEQARLIDEIMLVGENTGYAEIRLENLHILVGFEGWSEFVSSASTNLLRQVRDDLSERQRREQQAAAGRQRLHALSHTEVSGKTV